MNDEGPNRFYGTESTGRERLVRVSCMDCGYPSDKEQANKLLDPQKTYMIVRESASSYHTTVWLKEFPGVPFNSVHFSPAP